MKFFWNESDGHHFCIMGDILLTVAPSEKNAAAWICTIKVPDANYVLNEHTIVGPWEEGAHWCEFVFANFGKQDLLLSVALVGSYVERLWSPVSTGYSLMPATSYECTLDAYRLNVWQMGALWLWQTSQGSWSVSGKSLTLIDAKRHAVLSAFGRMVEATIIRDANTVEQDRMRMASERDIAKSAI